MHESDSFISEVSEEVRRERFFGFLRRWGWLLALGAVAIVGAAGVHQWLGARDQTRAAAAGDAVAAAFAEVDFAARADRLAALAAENPRAAPVLRLAVAGSRAEAGDAAAAGEVLAGVAGDGAVPGLYRDIAALQRVMLLGADLPASERLATLQGLAADGAPFRTLALEQRALAQLDAGDTAAARADLEAAIADPGAPPGLRERAGQLLVAVGGSLPGPAGLALPADG